MYYPTASSPQISKVLPDFSALLKIYRWVEAHLPPGELSIRDLQQLAVRWLHATEFDIERSLEDQHYWLYRACEREWHYRFPNPEDKTAFLQYLKQTFPQAPPLREEKSYCLIYLKIFI